MHWLTWALTYRVAGYLGDCVGCYFGLLLAWKLSKRSWEKSSQRLTTLAEKLHGLRSHLSGHAAYAPVWFVAGLAAIIVLGAKHLPTYEVVELHDVRVEKKVRDNEWMMSDPVNGSFLYTACGDFPNDRVIWAGYIARRVKYEEHGNCKSIERAGLGFWWLRDSEGNARTIQ